MFTRILTWTTLTMAFGGPLWAQQAYRQVSSSDLVGLESQLQRAESIQRRMPINDPRTNGDYRRAPRCDSSGDSARAVAADGWHRGPNAS